MNKRNYRTKIKKLFFASIIAIAFTSCESDKNGWDKTTETSFKINCKKAMLANSSMTDEQAGFITDCLVEKIKQNNIKAVDVEKIENRQLILQFGKECRENWNKQQQK